MEDHPNAPKKRQNAAADSFPPAGAGPPSRTAALDCIPLPSAEVIPKRLEDRLVELCYPMVMRPFWAAVARRLGVDQQNTRRLQLDEMGTAVWDLIDAKRSVRQVARDFARRFQLDDQEAQTAVVTFLRELGRRGIIGMKERR